MNTFNKNNKNYKNNKNNKNNKFCKVCYDANLPESEYTSHWVKDKPGKNGIIVCPYLLSLECRYCKEKGHTPKHCPKILLKNEYNNEKIQKKIPEKISDNKSPTPDNKSPTKQYTSLKSKKNIFNILTDDSDSEQESDYETDTETKPKSVSAVSAVNVTESKEIVKINNNDFPCLLKINKTTNSSSDSEKKLNNWISILKKKPSTKPSHKPSTKQIIQTQPIIQVLPNKEALVKKIQLVHGNINDQNIEEKPSIVEEKENLQKNKNTFDLSFNINPNMRWADIMDEEDEDDTAF